MAEQLKVYAPRMLFIVDEFHKAMSKSKRTSITLEVSRLAKDFIGLSGIIIRDTNIDELLQWLAVIVEFEITEHNYFVGVGSLISRKAETGVSVIRELVEAKLLHPERYYAAIPPSLGGTAGHLDFRAALAECYTALRRG